MIEKKDLKELVKIEAQYHLSYVDYLDETEKAIFLKSVWEFIYTNSNKIDYEAISVKLQHGIKTDSDPENRMYMIYLTYRVPFSRSHEWVDSNRLITALEPKTMKCLGWIGEVDTPTVIELLTSVDNSLDRITKNYSTDLTAYSVIKGLAVSEAGIAVGMLGWFLTVILTIMVWNSF